MRNPDKEPAPTVAQSDHAGPRPASPKSTDTVQSSDSTGDKQSGLVRIRTRQIELTALFMLNHRLAFKDARQTTHVNFRTFN